jgi:hypothetical protein
MTNLISKKRLFKNTTNIKREMKDKETKAVKIKGEK